MNQRPCDTCKHQISPVAFPTLPPPRTPQAAAVVQHTREMAEHRKAKERVLAGSRGALRANELPLYEAHCAALSPTDGFYLCAWAEPSCPEFTPRAGYPMPVDDHTASLTPGVENGANVHPPAEACSAPSAPTVPRPSVVEIGVPLALKVEARPDQDSTTSDGRPTLVESYSLQARAEKAVPLRISGEGWYQSYLIFGGPGAGKTHLYKKLLKQVLGAPTQVPPGALILDPKGVLQAEVKDIVESCGRGDDLRIINGGGAEAGMRVNLLACSQLRPRDLGRVVAEVVLAEAGGIGDGWQVLVFDLLESAAVLIAAEKQPVTPAALATDLLRKDAAGSALITARARRLLDRTEPEVRDAVDRLSSYYAQTEAKTRRFVSQIIEQTLGELKDDRWASLSDPDGGDIYDEIVSRSRILLLSIGQSSPSFQRFLGSMVKALFQQAVLATPVAKGSDRFTLLACDEYAQVATEGTSGLVSDSAFFSLSREYHCLSILALQSAATGRSRFPGPLRDRWDAILGNIGGKIFMRLNDVETAQLASEHAGERQVFIPVDATSSGSVDRGVTHNLSMTQRRAVPHWVLTQVLRRGQGLIVGTLDGGLTVGWNFFGDAPAGAQDA